MNDTSLLNSLAGGLLGGGTAGFVGGLVLKKLLKLLLYVAAGVAALILGLVTALTHYGLVTVNPNASTIIQTDLTNWLTTTFTALAGWAAASNSPLLGGLGVGFAGGFAAGLAKG